VVGVTTPPEMQIPDEVVADLARVQWERCTDGDPNWASVDDATHRHGLRVARLDLLGLAAAGYVVIKDDGADHIIDFGPHGWTIKHPPSCRPNLFDCPVNRAAVQEITDEPASGLGRYTVSVDAGGVLLVEGPQ